MTRSDFPSRALSMELTSWAKEGKDGGELRWFAGGIFISSFVPGPVPKPRCCSVSLRNTSNACLKAANGSESAA